jgi:signal peptidase II
LFRNRVSERTGRTAILAVAAVVLAVDQLTKHAVTRSLLPGESRTVIPHLLRWTFERNVHGAFGLFGSNPVLLIAMAIVVLLLFWSSFVHAAERSWLVRVGIGMIVGGALGNITDRLHYHYVVDFIDFYVIWPYIFNIADACITIGVGFLLLSSLASHRRA